MQEAFAVALERWPGDGVPDNPGAWITRVARNKAIDRLRRERTLRVKKEVLEGLETAGAGRRGDRAGRPEPHAFPDDRLRLIFTCCHPALAPEARVALTLRTLGGLTTAEIASGLPDDRVDDGAAPRAREGEDPRSANIPYEVPRPAQLPERLPAVLATLYLVFNEGYLASASDSLVRVELADEAIRLARVLVVDPSGRAGGPGAAGADAASALAARRPRGRRRASWCCSATRTARSGTWTRSGEGLELVGTLEGRRARTRSRPRSPPSTAAPRPRTRPTGGGSATLYGRLRQVQPTPVVELNRAVAVAMADGPEAGPGRSWTAIEGLDGYQPFHSTRADLLRRLDRSDEAADAYRRASSSPRTRSSAPFSRAGSPKWLTRHMRAFGSSAGLWRPIRARSAYAPTSNRQAGRQPDHVRALQARQGRDRPWVLDPRPGAARRAL